MVSPPKNRSSTRRACSSSERGEPVEGLIERDEIDGSIAAGDQALVERDALPLAAALLRVARARPLDQDLAHRMRRDGTEVRPVLPAAGLVLAAGAGRLRARAPSAAAYSRHARARGSSPPDAAAPGKRSAAASRPTADRPRPSDDPLDGDVVHHDGLDRAILPPGRHRANLLHHVEPFDDLAEHRSGGCRDAASDRA